MPAGKSAAGGLIDDGITTRIVTMSTVAEIIDAVKHLNEEEKDEFLEKLREVEFEDAWDRQMEADAKAGKLDFLVREADEAIRGETLKDWPPGPHK